jgi:hypothetical protein
MSSKEFLEHISSQCYMNKTPYQFTKDKSMDKAYIDGRVRVYDWVDKLCFRYLLHEKHISDQFIDNIKQQRDALLAKSDGTFHQGIKESFDDVLGMIEKTNKKS